MHGRSVALSAQGTVPVSTYLAAASADDKTVWLARIAPLVAAHADANKARVRSAFTSCVCDTLAA